MNELSEIAKRESRLLCGTYARYPLHLVQGRGARVIDAQGREYVDLLAGIAVCVLGHCHPEITRVIAEQAARLVHVSNLFYQTQQLELAERLLAGCDLDRVFFCNSGAEANEAAIKLVRRYAQEVAGGQAFEIITLQGSFHGRTLATLTATGQDKIKTGFDPLPSGFVSVPFEDGQGLEEAITPRTAAIMLEVIQGEGGIRQVSEVFASRIQDLCTRHGLLLVIDEVQTGMGRTGRLWAHQHTGLKPDIMTVAKGLANGLPIGAMLCTQEVSQGFGPGSHATTFGGGPLVSAAAAAVLDIIEDQGLCARAGALGAMCREELAKVQARHPQWITQIRGQGLMLGIELASSGREIWQALLDQGFICNLTQDRVLRLVPPLIVEEQDLRAFLATLEGIVQSHEL